MDDFVISNLHESRNEWCSRLVSIFTPLVIDGIRSILNESWTMCMNNDEANKYLSTLIKTDAPFFVGRLGFHEGEIVAQYLSLARSWKINDIKSILKHPVATYKRAKFARTISHDLVESIYDCDAIAYTATSPRVSDAIGIICSSKSVIKGIPDIVMTPMRFEKPWVSSLNNKKILVITAFKTDVESQIRVLDEVWKNYDQMYFSSSIVCVEAPFYFQDWRAGYCEILDKISRLNFKFDIALIAAGAVSNLIGQHIRTRLGRQAIVTGGSLQLFFGIIGQRWINSGSMDNFINQAWIRPSRSKPSLGRKYLDNNCYW